MRRTLREHSLRLEEVVVITDESDPSGKGAISKWVLQWHHGDLAAGAAFMIHVRPRATAVVATSIRIRLSRSVNDRER